MIRSLPLATRRVRQSVGSFDNGPRVLADLLTGRITGKPDELRFRVRGRNLDIACPNRPGARVPVYEIFAEDAYRVAELTRDLGPRPVILDIGAQIGCFSLALATAMPEATVHSYEASPVTASWLSRNVERNRLDGRVVVHAEAVSDEAGTLEFWDNGQASGLNGDATRGGSQVQVPAVTFADAVSAAGGAASLVKIDTEGAEYSIVLGSGPENWTAVQRVVLEYHDVPGHSWEELREFFSAAGLEQSRLEPATPRVGTVWLERR